MRVRLRVTEPAALDELRRFLRKRGCASVVLGDDMLEVSVVPPSPDALRFERVEKEAILRHVREFSSRRFGVRVNIVSDDPWYAAGRN